MMRAVAETTRPHGIHTVVSLNSVMVDGTGMCGGCRVLVDGESKFACVDGPEFDAHKVDFEMLMKRNAAYRGHEQASLTTFQSNPQEQVEGARRCRLEEEHPEVAGKQISSNA
jgi:ferredoxin--NADP+ reductase